MKNINAYIIEKLVIDKDSSIHKYDTAVSCITDICSINFSKTYNNKIIDTIENWCRENNITSMDDFICTAPLDFMFRNYNTYYDRLNKNGWVNKVKQSKKNVLQDLDSKNAKLTTGESLYKKIYTYEENGKHILLYVFEFLDGVFFLFEPADKK